METLASSIGIVVVRHLIGDASRWVPVRRRGVVPVLGLGWVVLQDQSVVLQLLLSVDVVVLLGEGVGAGVAHTLV